MIRFARLITGRFDRCRTLRGRITRRQRECSATLIDQRGNPQDRWESGNETHRASIYRGRKAPRRPRGFTLIEMLIVMGVTSLVAVIATSILFAMVRQHSAMQQHLRVGTSQRRLASSFRHDVQLAETIEMLEAAIVLDGPRGRVTYTHLPPGIIRRTASVDAAPRFDDFELSANDDLRFASEKMGDRTIVKLVIRPSGRDESAPSRAMSRLGMTTVAELARDHRWVAEEE